jgi:hypothetical protein
MSTQISIALSLPQRHFELLVIRQLSLCCSKETPISVLLYQEQHPETLSSVARQDRYGSQLPQADLFQDLDHQSFQDSAYHSFRLDDVNDYS